MALLWFAMGTSHVIRVTLGVVAPTLMALYNIPPKTMGYVLSGWNWAYTAGLLGAGPVVERFGPWVTMGAGMGAWGVATLALPLATSAAALFAMRALFGGAHSVLLPANAFAISHWFPAERRATAVGLSFSGNQVGSAIGTTISAIILSSFGWKAVFYVTGGASLLLTVAWFALYPGERGGPLAASPSSGNVPTPRVPWRRLLRFRATWAVALGQMGYLYALFFFISWMPTYLLVERKMSLLNTGLYAAFPFWAGMIGTLVGGWLGDRLIERGVSRTASRKGIIGAGLTLATIMVVAAAFAPQTWLAVVLLTLCLGSLRIATASLGSLPIDLAPPPAVASLTSIQNFGGNVGGLLAPIATGYIVQGTGSFVGALILAGGMAMVGAVAYVGVLGRIEPVPD